jgi:FkbM family methyltransferase
MGTQTWEPPYTWEERLKYSLIPPRLYMWRLVRKHLKRGEPELKILPQLVARERMAIDVGANKGIYTHVLAKLCRHVHAFEPNPKIHRILTRALPTNATAHAVALSDRAETAAMTIPIYKGGYSNQHATLRDHDGEHGSLPVECRTLDSYGFSGVGFIKIDVEGHERAVLEGAAETIRRERPTLLVEMEERHTGKTIEQSLQFMDRFGMTGFFVRDGRLTPLIQFHPERDHRATVGRAGYVNNFIFAPRAP